MLNYQRVVRVPLGSFRILWHVILLWRNDAKTLLLVMWGDDMDLITTQIVDDVAVVPGPGAGRILDSDLESDYEGLHAQNRWAKYASFVYVYMHVQVIDVHIMFQQHLSAQSNPTSLSAWKTLKEVRFLSPEGQFSWGTRVWEHRIKPIPHQAG